jgi:hypothetical protein
MIRSAMVLLAAAVCCAAAAPPQKPPAKAPAAKSPAPKAPAAKAAPKPPAAAPWDAQSPQGLMDLLAAAGAKAQVARKDEDAIFLTVTSAAANFSIQFAGCNAQGRGCQAALFDAILEKGAPTLPQVNGFNQTSVMCRLYQDRTGKAHVLYSSILTRADTRDSVRTHLAAWQGCLVEASDFVRDPVTYLANAA